MHKATTILFKYPEADPLRDFQVMDLADDKGPQLVEWNLPHPKPTEADLAAWEKEYLDHQKATEYSRRREAKYAERLPDGHQLDAFRKGFKALKATGIVLPPELESVLAEADAIKAEEPKPTT